MLGGAQWDGSGPSAALLVQSQMPATRVRSVALSWCGLLNAKAQLCRKDSLGQVEE